MLSHCKLFFIMYWKSTMSPLHDAWHIKQCPPLPWEDLVRLQRILLNIPTWTHPYAWHRASSWGSTYHWWLHLGFISLQILPWRACCSDVIVRLVADGPWSQENNKSKGTAAVIQCDSSPSRGAVILYVDLSRDGEFTTSTHSGSGWIPERAVVWAHYRSPVKNQAQSSPSTWKSDWWGKMHSLKNHRFLFSWLHCRDDDGKLRWGLRVGSQHSSFLTWGVKSFKVICLKRSSSGFWLWLLLILLMRKPIKKTQRKREFYWLSFFFEMTTGDIKKRKGGFLVGAGPVSYQKGLAESQLPKKELVRKWGRGGTIKLVRNGT